MITSPDTPDLATSVKDGDESTQRTRPKDDGTHAIGKALGDSSLSTESRDFYQKVYQQYHNAVTAFFMSRGYNKQEAMDGLQDVYLRVIRLSEPAQLADMPKAYLLKVATNIIRDNYRKKRATQLISQDVQDLDQIPSLSPSPEQQLLVRQQVGIVKDAMSELSESHRQIFALHRMDGLTCHEISEQTQTSLRTVQRKLSDALAYCVLKIKQEVEVH